MNKSFIFLLTLFFFITACQPIPQLRQFKGKTMGTYYIVSYVSTQAHSYQSSIDSLLLVINDAASTYIPASDISSVNKSAKDSETLVSAAHFAPIFKKAKAIYTATNGSFNPTVMPLVNAWGFGYEKKEANLDSLQVDSLLHFIDFEALQLAKNKAGQTVVKKNKAGVQLDFSAIAKGYAVDAIGDFLLKKGITDFLIDIGGELTAKGKNAEGNWWTIGIDKPVDSLKIREAQEIVQLQNRAIATSGNYRNFYEEAGKKYVHTINPKTGFPEISNLLSVSVFANDCMTADAYATACMVMGYKKAKTFVAQQAEIEAIFIYADAKGEIHTDVSINSEYLLVPKK